MLDEPTGDLVAWENWLERMENEASQLLGRLEASSRIRDEEAGESNSWARALVSQVLEHRAELSALAPWLSLMRDRDRVEPESAVKGLDRQGTGADLANLLRLDELSHRSEDEAVSCTAAVRLRDRLLKLIGRAEALAAAMDFRPLYKPDRHLFAIGANLSQGQLDGACYDLLASECCLTSYLTVARGDTPRRHWFQLGALTSGRPGR